MLSDSPRLGRVLDLSVSIVLAFGVVLLFAIFGDLLTPPAGTAGQNPNFPWNAIGAFAFIGVLSSPIIFSAVLWPIHLRRKRRGERVFGWLPFVPLASTVWMWFVYSALQGL